MSEFNPNDPSVDCARLNRAHFAEVTDSLRNSARRQRELQAEADAAQARRLIEAEAELAALRAENAALKAVRP